MNSLQNTKVLGIGAMVYIPNGELLCTERVEGGGGGKKTSIFLGIRIMIGGKSFHL